MAAAPSAAAAISLAETWSEPNVPSPMAGIVAPVESLRCGIAAGSIGASGGGTGLAAGAGCAMPVYLARIKVNANFREHTFSPFQVSTSILEILQKRYSVTAAAAPSSHARNFICKTASANDNHSHSSKLTNEHSQQSCAQPRYSASREHRLAAHGQPVDGRAERHAGHLHGGARFFHRQRRPAAYRRQSVRVHRRIYLGADQLPGLERDHAAGLELDRAAHRPQAAADALDSRL